jgi:hypothetical protein
MVVLSSNAADSEPEHLGNLRQQEPKTILFDAGKNEDLKLGQGLKLVQKRLRNGFRLGQ